MTTVKTTLEDIEKFLRSATGGKIDAAQMDGLRVLIEEYAVRMSGVWKQSPSEALHAHVANLETLARQLLDTGGRMRLDRAGQLDDPANPIATRQDMRDLARKMVAVSAGVQEVTGKLDGRREPDIDRVVAAVSGAEERLGAGIRLVMSSAPDVDLRPVLRELKEMRAEVSKLSAGAPALPLPPPVLSEETREHIRQHLSRDKTVPEPAEPPKVLAGCEINPDGTITCRRCGEPKDPSEFYRDKQARTGYKSQCKPCERDFKAARLAA